MQRRAMGDDLGLLGIGVEPGFAIGQRALVIREGDGCVLWDCIPLATTEAIRRFTVTPLSERSLENGTLGLNSQSTSLVKLWSIT